MTSACINESSCGLLSTACSREGYVLGAGVGLADGLTGRGGGGGDDDATGDGDGNGGGGEKEEESGLDDDDVGTGGGGKSSSLTVLSVITGFDSVFLLPPPLDTKNNTITTRTATAIPP